ncbi:MAG TPA: hypothetical protein VLE49_06745, partial [Anaerolineales bacterium]|nr:hypothetical protein [Anaerolineales bacterium]
EITLAEEHAYYFVPQISLEVAQDRVEKKKTGLIAGAVGTLISRPNPAEMPLVSVENRLEPYWVVTVSTHTAYDRQAAYAIPIKGEEVREVTLLGQKLTVSKGALSLNGTEHCVEERRTTRFFDGLSGQKADLSRYQSFAKTEVSDLANFAPQGILVVPPEMRATAVVRQMLGEVIQPVSKAQVIHEERVDVETIELNFRPVYALEYEWTSKGKRVVIEFDALLGDIRSGGKKWSDQIKGILTRDLFFDVTADAIGMIVPGGSIAVKLVKAVVDRGKK